LNSLEGKTYILTDKNSDALAYYDRFKNDYDVVYSKQFDLSDEYIDYKDNSLILKLMLVIGLVILIVLMLSYFLRLRNSLTSVLLS